MCDGGRTFLLAGEALIKSGISNIELAITHGVFSGNYEAIKDMFSLVHVTNSLPQYVDFFIKKTSIPVHVVDVWNL